jgi:hypothetical protein
MQMVIMFVKQQDCASVADIATATNLPLYLQVTTLDNTMDYREPDDPITIIPEKAFYTRSSMTSTRIKSTYKTTTVTDERNFFQFFPENKDRSSIGIASTI